ncbi:MAG: adenine deaminase [Bacteroidaceae bacterium]|nr:adenine deaminase [Bacteroidaceae bacterium]
MDDDRIVSGHIVDVLNREIYDGSVVVRNGRIESIVRSEVSSDAPYILPGMVDSHVHIESTLLIPEKYAALAVEKGVVAVVSDPHEIANVLGVPGVMFMIENGRKVRFHFNFAASPVVPCTTFETAGASFSIGDIEALLSRDDIYGLGEFMNVPGVVSADSRCQAILDAVKRVGKPIDGHAPGATKDVLRLYADAGVTTDHECVTLSEAYDHLDVGIKVIIREGSASCDFEALSPLLAECTDSLMFCSDDKYPGELLEGYIDSLVRRSLAKGMPLWNVLNAACVTPVRHYGLRNGLLQQGDSADFIVVDNLQDFNVLSTFIDGRAVYENGMLRSDELLTDPSPLDVMPNRFAAGSITADDIRVTPAGELMKVIVAENLSIRTGMKYVRPLVKDGNVISDTGHDVLKMVVCNRYESAAPQMAFISGFRLKRGAMASTIAHDSHNIVAVGASDAELVRVINRLTELRGGIVISDGNGGISELPLPVAGLMSPLDGREVARRFSHLLSQAASQGCPFSAAFMTLSFMCLPVIPDLKLTDKGLFDVRKFGFTNLFV